MTRAIRAGALGLAIALAIGCESSPTIGTRREPEASPAAIAPVSPPPPAPSAAPSAPPGALAVSCQASPRGGRAPLRVEFTSSVSSAGDHGYEWAFGDGEGSNNPSPAHTYVSPGTFEATVRVRTATEEASCTRSIEVEPAATPGNPPSATPPPAPSPTPTPSPTPPPPPGRTLTLTTSGFNYGGTAHTQPGGISCTHPPACTATATFAHGTTVTIVGSPFGAPPDPYARATISGACSASNQGGPASCQVVMDADKSVDVWFFRSSFQPVADDDPHR